jgi:hypothetical protein
VHDGVRSSTPRVSTDEAPVLSAPGLVLCCELNCFRIGPSGLLFLHYFKIRFLKVPGFLAARGFACPRVPVTVRNFFKRSIS